MSRLFSTGSKDKDVLTRESLLNYINNDGAQNIASDIVKQLYKLMVSIKENKSFEGAGK